MKKIIAIIALSFLGQTGLRADGFLNAQRTNITGVQTAWGLAATATGLYVSDWESDQIYRYDSNGQKVATLGHTGSLPGEFYGPKGLSVDENGRIYVADAGNGRVQVLEANGDPVAQWGDPTQGAGTDGYSPEDVKLGPNGRVYVSDADNHRIVIFDRQGNFLGTWGHLAFTGTDGFAWPEGLGLDSAGNVYVTDSGNGRVLCYDGDGHFIKQVGGRGIGQGQFDSPMGVVVRNDGVVFVADNGGQRVQAFDANGNFLFWWGENLNGAYFQDLYDLAQAPDGRILVADGMSGDIYNLSWDGLVLTDSPWGSQIAVSRTQIKDDSPFTGAFAVGPVPAHPGEELCLAFATAPVSGEWRVYSIDGRLLADVHFDGQNPQCWNGSNQFSRGVYLVELRQVWSDGTHKEKIQKIVLN